MQSTVGVVSTHAVSPEVVAETLACLDSDLPPAGIKIGMLATSANVLAVAAYLEGFPRRPVTVLDPVLRSTSGRELLDPDGLRLMRERLLPLVDWVTPNAAELEVLTGRPSGTADEVVAACGLMVGARAGRPGVIATGGDRTPPDDLLMMPSGESLWLAGDRVETRATHGTGCAFSSALLCGLVAGLDAETAARSAKAYVRQAMVAAVPLGAGHGPMRHLWPLLRK